MYIGNALHLVNDYAVIDFELFKSDYLKKGTSFIYFSDIIFDNFMDRNLKTRL